MRRSPDGWFIVDHPANCCPRPDGPGPTTPVRGVAQAAQRRTCLQDASTPELPDSLCPAARVATVVVSGAAFGARSEMRDRQFGTRWYPSSVPVP